MIGFVCLFVAASSIGHLAIWVLAFNQLHALRLPCAVIKRLEKGLILIAAFLPLLILWHLHSLPGDSYPAALAYASPFVQGYFAVCWVMCLYALIGWLWRTSRRQPAALVTDDTQVVDLAQTLGHRPVAGRLHEVASQIPGNELFQLHIHEKTLQLSRLPEKLQGWSILHLSDLHITGGITRPFFEALVDRANDLDCDLVAITGDIVEADDCLDWLGQTLGRLSSRHGVYFVLGNHDKRLTDVSRLRRLLTDHGLVDLGGRRLETTIDGSPVLLAGNELPWFGPAPEIDSPSEADDPPQFRILLSHSPDQLPWAKERGFDLMLAGHTHGGQIRLPLIGPVISPSRYGVRYASGTFDEPPTLMHVSRGVSGLHPFRFNCPPELARLTLRRLVSATSREDVASSACAHAG